MIYWTDPRALACKIQINHGLVSFILEESFEREFSNETIEKVTLKIEQRIMHCLGFGKNVPPLPEMCEEYLLEVTTTPLVSDE